MTSLVSNPKHASFSEGQTSTRIHFAKLFEKFYENMASQQKYLERLLCDIEKRVVRLHVTFDSTQKRADAIEQRLNSYLERINKETILVTCLETLRSTEKRYASLLIHALRMYLVEISDFVYETNPSSGRWSNERVKSLLLQREDDGSCEQVQRQLCEHFEISSNDMFLLSIIAELVGWNQDGRRSQTLVPTPREFADMLDVIDEAVSKTDVTSLLKRIVQWNWQRAESPMGSGNAESEDADDQSHHLVECNINNDLSTEREYDPQHLDSHVRRSSNDRDQNTPGNYSPRHSSNSPRARGSYSPRNQARHIPRSPRSQSEEGTRAPVDLGIYNPRISRDDMDLLDSPREWRFSNGDQSST